MLNGGGKKYIEDLISFVKLNTIKTLNYFSISLETYPTKMILTSVQSLYVNNVL